MFSTELKVRRRIVSKREESEKKESRELKRFLKENKWASQTFAISD